MARAEAEAASHAATTTALHQMCLQLHTTAADNAAANKAAMTEVLLLDATLTVALYRHCHVSTSDMLSLVTQRILVSLHDLCITPDVSACCAKVTCHQP